MDCKDDCKVCLSTVSYWCKSLNIRFLWPGRLVCIEYHSRFNWYLSDCGTAVCCTHLLNHTLYTVPPLLSIKAQNYIHTHNYIRHLLHWLSCLPFLRGHNGYGYDTSRILKGKVLLIVHDLRVLIIQLNTSFTVVSVTVQSTVSDFF